MSEPVKCRHCNGELTLDVVEQIKDRARFTIALTPKPGEMMRAETIGGTLVELAKLMRATSKAHGRRESLLVERVVSNDVGQIEIHMINCLVLKDGSPA